MLSLLLEPPARRPVASWRQPAAGERGTFVPTRVDQDAESTRLQYLNFHPPIVLIYDSSAQAAIDGYVGWELVTLIQERLDGALVLAVDGRVPYFLATSSVTRGRKIVLLISPCRTRTLPTPEVSA